MAPQHFWVDMSSEQGEWMRTKRELKKGGRYHEVWNRADSSGSADIDQVFVVSSPTNNGQYADINKLMRKALFPVKYMPGTKTEVLRESESEALFVWHTPNGHHSVVRITAQPDRLHAITYLHKGTKLSEEEISRRSEFLDTLKLTYCK